MCPRASIFVLLHREMNDLKEHIRGGGVVGRGVEVGGLGGAKKNSIRRSSRRSIREGVGGVVEGVVGVLEWE